MKLKRIQFWGEDKNDDRLVRQIIKGHKTATACPAKTYHEHSGDYDDGGYVLGDLVEVYDLRARLRCIIQITDYYVTPFGEIPEKLWRGEANASAEEFRQEHIKCWPDFDLTDDFLIAVNHFKLIKVTHSKESNPS
ncbi:MAG: ASCH domain-containing protein [Acidiferrobacterales bacterium]|nr:ASCH domain-containing protein [Acidiferrobacterales bacterium]